MEKKAKKTRGRKPQILEEDDKQKESIMEEISNISGKPMEVSLDKDKTPPPSRMKRAVKKQKTSNAKTIVKKSDVSAPTIPPTKQKKLDVSKQKKLDVTEKDVDTEAYETKSCEKGLPVPNLPGWRKEVSIRKSGASAGKADVYFYSPAGSKLRSRPEVSAYLKTHKITDIKVEEFDFTKTVSNAEEGKVVENSKPKAKTTKNTPNKKKPKPVLKPTSVKRARSEKSADVPSCAEKNADGKSNKVLIKILESKPKKSRK